ncbi:MAG: hypothetical protein K0Q56_2224 [Sporolactobacillus laevolacticus]|jgi:hypothetical protein|nr:hypothetical protein [Sporolactobacillus laevolacticus]
MNIESIELLFIPIIIQNMPLIAIIINCCFLKKVINSQNVHSKTFFNSKLKNPPIIRNVTSTIG